MKIQICYKLIITCPALGTPCLPSQPLPATSIISNPFFSNPQQIFRPISQSRPSSFLCYHFIPDLFSPVFPLLISYVFPKVVGVQSVLGEWWGVDGMLHYQAMSFWKSKSLNGGSITRILTECDHLQRSPSKDSPRYLLPKLNHSATLPDQSAANTQTLFKLPTPRKRQLRVSNRQLSLPPKSPPTINRRRLRKDQFGGDISLSSANKGAFCKMVVKFKKSFQPANASRGGNSTSNELANLAPRRVQLFSDEREEEATRGELKRLHILSRVINENTRREIKLWRERSASKYQL